MSNLEDEAFLDTQVYNSKFRRDLYICDPEKNKACNKAGCAWLNGLTPFHRCFATSYFEYAVTRTEEMERLLENFGKQYTGVNDGT